MKTRTQMILIVCFAFWCSSCAATTREQANVIAISEIAHRRLPLPPNHTVHVIRGDGISQYEPPYIIWMVEITPPKRKERFYSIYVDCVTVESLTSPNILTRRNGLTRRCSERLPVVRPTLPMTKPIHLRSALAPGRRR